MSIPFEVLDIHMGNKISLKLNKIFDKVIHRRRGGYCYELNALFNAFLTQIGYDSYLISAKIYDQGKFGPEFDHMAIIVRLDNLWLIDVGHGDLFIEPVQIIPDVLQEGVFKHFKINKSDTNEYLLSESLKQETNFICKYKFSTVPRTVKEFEKLNLWKQSSKESFFVQNRVCTLPNENGRKTIMNSTFKIKTENHIEKTEIKSDAQLLEILKLEFNIDLKFIDRKIKIA